MNFNRLTLAFTGIHADLEPHFRTHYFTSTLNQNRIALLAGFIFYGAFAVLDAIAIPDQYLKFWFIRWAIVCPCLFMAFLSTYFKHTRTYFQYIFGFGTLAAGLGIVAMLHLSGTSSNYAYEGGLIQILFFLFTFVRMRFLWGCSLATALVLIYAVSFTISGAMANDYLIGKAFHLSLVCIMGMMAGYTIEYQARKNFLLSHQLELKKRRLAKSNVFLEQRVSERTSELRRTNSLLKEEIKEREIIESALRDSQKRYLRMVNNVTDHMCVYDMNGEIREANRQMIAGLGYSMETLSEINYVNLLVPEQRAHFFQYITDMKRKGTAEGTMTLVTSSGERRLFEYSNVLAEHTCGHKAVFSLARDVTHRRKTEKALADSQLQFRNIFETAAAGMAIIDRKNQHIAEINSVAAQWVGLPADQIKGRHFDTLISMPEDGIDRQLPVPTQHPVECLLDRIENKPLPVLASTRATLFHDRPHLIVSFVNIERIKEAEREKRELEQRANRMQHLESIGTLAGGIAHDFNNILFGIMGFAELALDDAGSQSAQARNLREILKGGHRAKEMISQILTFSRQDTVARQIIEPASIIKEALKLIRATFPSSIEIKSSFASNLHQIKSNPTQLHQVIMNLCTNAAHAIGDQIGRIEIGVDNVSLTSDEITPHGKLSKGEYFQIIVQDTGSGIPEDVVERIFEPYFTTKAQGEGSGMGLSVVLGIVQSLEGSIRVERLKEGGTAFQILLPACRQEVETKAVKAVQPATGNEHILLIDDERPLLIMLERMLTRLGYNVTTCEHSPEALIMFKEQSDTFDLVITDLTMPRMTGIQLSRELLNIRPDLPIILCTGYNKKLSHKQLTSMGIREVLPKPILKGELAAVIRRAVESN